MDDVHDQRVLKSNSSVLSCLALSSSGRFLASGQAQPQSDVVIWDRERENPIYCFSEHDGGIVAIAFSDNERLCCSIDMDKRLFIWDLHSGNICATQKLKREAHVVKFGTQYNFAVAGDRLLSLYTLNPSNGELIQCNIDQKLIRNYGCLQYSPDMQQLIAGSSSGDVAVILVGSGRIIFTIPVCSCGVSSIVYDHDKIFIAGGDGTITQFSVDFVSQRRVQLDGSVHSLSVSRTQNIMLAGTVLGTIYTLYIQDGLQDISSCLFYENPSDVIMGIAYASDSSEYFATISLDRYTRLWNASDYSIVSKFKASDAGMPTSLQLSSSKIFSGWEDGRIRCHNISDGTLFFTLDDAHTSAVCTLLLGSKLLFSGGADGEIRAWDIHRRRMIYTAREHANAITSLVTHDTYLISASRDGSITCWDLVDFRKLKSNTRNKCSVTFLVIDANVMITAGMDENILYWDMQDTRVIGSIDMAHVGKVECLALTHSKGMLATAGSDHLLKLWNVRTKTLLIQMNGHWGRVKAMVFSPDDRQLITGGEDGCIMIWNLYTQ